VRAPHTLRHEKRQGYYTLACHLHLLRALAAAHSLPVGSSPPRSLRLDQLVDDYYHGNDEQQVDKPANDTEDELAQNP
jgi:hypothetical protein